MLEVHAKNMFSSHYSVLESGQEITSVNIRWIREAGEFVLGGKNYMVGRRSRMSGAFFVEWEGKTLASAIKPSWLFQRFTISVGEDKYQLRSRSIFTRAFDLIHNGRTIGSLEAQSWFKRSVRVDLPQELPLPVQVFITWLVLVMWRRQQANGSS
jgi:hypothetical protein